MRFFFCESEYLVELIRNKLNCVLKRIEMTEAEIYNNLVSSWIETKIKTKVMSKPWWLGGRVSAS